jgi:hypothetical protein
MPIIKLNEAKPGMVVSKNVMNCSGELFNGSTNILLVPSKTEIKERHIDIMRSWGVKEFEVEHCQKPEQGSLLDVDEVRSQIRSRFYSPNESDPVFHETMRVLVQREVDKKERQDQEQALSELS